MLLKENRSLDARKSLYTEANPPSKPIKRQLTTRAMCKSLRLPPGALGCHGVRALEARSRIGVRSTDGAAFKSFASLEAAHVVSLDAVRAVGVFFFVVATAFTRVYAIGGRISLSGVLGHGARALVGVMTGIAIGCATRVAHHIVKIARRRWLALGSGVTR
jgi:hypothetical protein